MKVLIIPEDQELDRYILQPVIEALLADSGIMATVTVLPEPRLRGSSQALDPDLISNIVGANRGMVDLFLLIVDRDCDRDGNGRRATQREGENSDVLISCVAVQEVEVWMLALYADQIGVSFSEVRDECDPKERFSQPLLKILGDDGPGRGRKKAMRAIKGSWKSLRSRCPELKELQGRIESFRDSQRNES